MPQLDHTGPEKKGSRTGRKLGKCASKDDSDYELGQGMGKRRKSESDCEGKGKRIKSSKLFNNSNK